MRSPFGVAGEEPLASHQGDGLSGACPIYGFTFTPLDVTRAVRQVRSFAQQQGLLVEADLLQVAEDADLTRDALRPARTATPQE